MLPKSDFKLRLELSGPAACGKSEIKNHIEQLLLSSWGQCVQISPKEISYKHNLATEVYDFYVCTSRARIIKEEQLQQALDFILNEYFNVNKRTIKTTNEVSSILNSSLEKLKVR